MAAAATDGETLFFIPDIGGFTKFVAEAEVRHSQHIVKDLLELLVDANTLGLEVAEFEGDAVLFYRRGAAPPLPALIAQARRMFVAFHGFLQRFEQMRICQCGACVGASRLGLKIVAHLGVAATMPVKSHVKFIGRDVIVAHRLLKNSVPEREYLLVTEGTLAGVKVEPLPPAGLEHPVKMMQVARRIDAPAERIYQMLIDLPARMRWIDGIRSIEFRDDEPNHIGKVHRCVRDGGDPELVTSDVRIDAESMESRETDTRRMASCRYLLTRAGDAATDVTLEFFVRRNLLVQLTFRALMQRKVKAGLERSLAKLATLCEQP